MADTTTLNEQVRSPLDGTEVIRLATTGANWRAQTGTSTWFLGGLGINVSSITFDEIGVNPLVQISNTTDGFLDLRRYTANALGPYISFVKSRGASIGTNTSVQSGDALGYILAGGYDGSTTPVLREGTGIVFEADSAPGTGTMFGRIRFRTNAAGTEAIRIDSSQRVTIGGVANQTAIPFEVDGTTRALSSMAIGTWNTTAGTPQCGSLNFNRSKAATIGTQTAVASGDSLGLIQGFGSDGTNFQGSVNFLMACDGTVSSGIVPGRWQVFTQSSAGGALIEALRVDSSQRTTIGGTQNWTGSQFEVDAGTSAVTGAIVNWSTTNNGSINIYKSKNNTIGTATATASGDSLGSYGVFGNDGTNFKQSTQILTVGDAAVSSGIVPGRFVFLTANSSGTLTEGIRLDSAQKTTFSGAMTQSAGGFAQTFTPSTSVFTRDVSGQSGFSIATGSNTAVIAGSTSHVAIVKESSVGSNAIYVVTGGSSTFVTSVGGKWVASTTTPGAGTSSYANNGTNWAIYNAQGSTITYHVYALNL